MSEAPEKREYFIKKRGYYYRPDNCGYTDRPILAGLYTEAEAKNTTHPNGSDGPRDGMWYFHESECGDADYIAFKALSARAATLEAKMAKAVDFVLSSIRYAGNSGDDFFADKARATLAEIQDG